MLLKKEEKERDGWSSWGEGRKPVFRRGGSEGGRRWREHERGEGGRWNKIVLAAARRRRPGIASRAGKTCLCPMQAGRVGKKVCVGLRLLLFLRRAFFLGILL